MTSLELRAPLGKFRVIGVDTFDGEDWIYFVGEDWIYGDYDTKEEAINLANEKGGNMLKTHVYDEKGKHIHEAGTF